MSALVAMPERLRRQRGRLAVVVILLAAAYFSVAFGQQAWRARQLQDDIAQQQAAIAQLDQQRDTLQAQVNLYSTDAYLTYVERRARRDLNLANPGETLLLTHWTPSANAAPAAQPTPTAAPEQPNWRRWLELFGDD